MSPLEATRILSDHDVRALLELDACVELQRQALLATTASTFERVPRSMVEVPGAALRVGSMLAVAPDGATAGCKVLAAAPTNRERGLPRSMSTIVLVDVPTGFPIALVSGTYLTNARTAATAVLAVETLCRPGSCDLGLLGAGPIAALILEVLAARGWPWEVAVYAPTAAHRDALVAGYDGHERLRVRSVADPRLAVGAEVVVTATDARAAAFDAAWLRADAVVVSIASRKQVGELPADALRGARLVVDDRGAVREEAAEFGACRPDDLVTLGETIAFGFLSPGALGMGRVVFKATGLAVQDVVTASAVYRLAVESGLGTSAVSVGN